MRRVELRSPLARAVAPVGAGLGFFLVLGLIMWGIAALMSGEQTQTTTFTPDRLPVGNVVRWAESIDADGPVIFPPANGEYPIIEDRTMLFIDLGERPNDTTTTVAG